MARSGDVPAWLPDEDAREKSNVATLMRDLRLNDYADLHAWSVRDRAAYWREVVNRLGIRFGRSPTAVLEPGSDAESARWLPGASLNIAESCFGADPAETAIVWREEGGPIRKVSYGALSESSNRVAAGLGRAGFAPGDAIAIDMPMTAESVFIYLGIVKSGCVVVSIADSFAPDEIRTRLAIAGAKGIFTQDRILRGGKALPLYDKVIEAGAPRAFVVAAGEAVLRPGDLPFDGLLAPEADFEAVQRDPDDALNVLFSSGTTGDPKAIPWTHTTPIKCAADGRFHQDIRPGHVVAWPTNLGWMMGPWLIFATLVNRGTIGLYQGAPTGRGFGEFVRDAKVSMLGVVPSLVGAWRSTGCMEGLDWSGIHVFSSTGESSNPSDMLYLMSLAGNRPVIEYCGGTEIGGGYVTGTVVQPAVPGTFTTPALGLDLVVLDEDGREAGNGEVFLVPPSIGLSTRLLNRDHHEVYHAGVPAGPRGETLRRHGDQIERLPGGGFRAHGRVDDTMNLGGIKVGSAEIERVLGRLEGVAETAAVGIPPPGGGPAGLVVFAVLEPDQEVEASSLRERFQAEIRRHLNPLFKVREVRVVPALPRTASNKVMRRVLRDKGA